jgi:hypothetical protein
MFSINIQSLAFEIVISVKTHENIIYIEIYGLSF